MLILFYVILLLQFVAVVDWEGRRTDVYARQFFEISRIPSFVVCENVDGGTVGKEPMVR